MSNWSRCQLGVDVNLESMFKLESMSTWSRSLNLESMFKLESMFNLESMFKVGVDV